MTTPSIGRALDASATLADQVARKFGPQNVVTDARELAAYEADGMRPAAAVRAGSMEEISDVLRFAEAEKLAVIPCAGRTKLGIGAPPVRFDIALDLSRMNRVLAYEPRDLTLGVEPGLRFEDLNQTLAVEKQFLPLAPSFAQRATIGGILAADSVSPLRHAYGGPRDFVLGMEFVTGYGAAAKSGGRVVKNVTGYDMHKLLIGSLGTLAVITRANFKTFPLSPAQAVFEAAFADAEAAFGFCRAVRNSALEPRTMDVISPQTVKLLKGIHEPEGAAAGLGWIVALKVAGHERVVARHERDLGALARQARADEFEALYESPNSGEDRVSLLELVREFPAVVLAAVPDAVIFRIAALPATLASLAEELATVAKINEISSATIVRPHGLVYFALLHSFGRVQEPIIHARASEEVFRVAQELGAMPRIEYAPIALKRAVNVWGAPRPNLELIRRVKKIFDPNTVLSPGRYVGGI